jgi:hypothetical protein
MPGMPLKTAMHIIKHKRPSNQVFYRDLPEAPPQETTHACQRSHGTAEGIDNYNNFPHHAKKSSQQTANRNKIMQHPRPVV